MQDNDDSKSKWVDTWSYKRAQAGVEAILASPKALLSLIERAAKKSKSPSSSTLGKSLESVKVMVRMTAAFARGEYRSVSLESMGLIIAALLYFVMPLDALPDFILMLGLTDDAALLAWTLSVVKDEVEKFLLWEIEQENRLGSDNGKDQ